MLSDHAAVNTQALLTAVDLERTWGKIHSFSLDEISLVQISRELEATLLQPLHTLPAFSNFLILLRGSGYSIARWQQLTLPNFSKVFTDVNR